MTTPTQKFWIRHTITLPDGHRLFRAFQPLPRGLMALVPATIALPPQGGIWALADESGETPEQTDDGVLLLDFSRSLDAGSHEQSPFIPLLDGDGVPRHSITNAATLLKLSLSFGWPINNLGVTVQAIEI